jgi:asparagine synthetase B (glutamine-hydrolysing)
VSNTVWPRTEAAPTAGSWVVRLTTGNGSCTFDAAISPDGDSAQLAADGGVRVFLGGLLHNRDELAAVLGEDHGVGPAAAVAAAYRRWGDALLGRLEGVFAVVIWDGDNETLLAARDALGSYPLFYAEVGRDLYLSNAIKTVVAQQNVSGAVNVAALGDHLLHRWPRQEETYFEAVRRLPPGHALRKSRGIRRIWRYWDPAPEGTVDWVEADELERFDALFERAVARTLASGPSGIFLSGGLDSVSVATVATAACRRDGLPDPWALSLAFPDPESNEEPRQRAVAAALELPQVMLAWKDAVAPNGLVAAALELNATSAVPLLNLWTPAYDRLALEGRARGCAVILTGNGGDEWLSVSPYYAADLMRTLDLRGLFRLFHHQRRSHAVSAPLYLRNILWRFGARPLLVDVAKNTLARSPALARRVRARRIRAGTGPWFAPDSRLRRSLVERNVEADSHVRPPHRRVARRHPRVYIREMRTGLDHPLVSMELEELFEQGRRLGMRMLQPYWDAPLVDFLYRTPPELLNREGRTKGLVRETVARRLPGLGFETQRKVSATRLARATVAAEGRKALSELGGTPALAEAGVVDAAALNERLSQVIGNPESPDYYLVWDLLALESWLRGQQRGGTA